MYTITFSIIFQARNPFKLNMIPLQTFLTNVATPLCIFKCNHTTVEGMPATLCLYVLLIDLLIFYPYRLSWDERVSNLMLCLLRLSIRVVSRNNEAVVYTPPLNLSLEISFSSMRPHWTIQMGVVT